MRKLIDIVNAQDLFEQDLFEMTNLRQSRTGLPYMVFVSPRGGAQHDARIKVLLPSKEFAIVGLRPVRVIHGEIPAKEFGQIKRWIKLNFDSLMEFWENEDMDSGDIIQKLEPISNPKPKQKTPQQSTDDSEGS